MLINVELAVASSGAFTSVFSVFCCFCFFVAFFTLFGGALFCFVLGADSSSTCSTTFGAIDFNGPKDRGAEYFLGPLGPRFSGLSRPLLPSPSRDSTAFALDETLKLARNAADGVNLSVIDVILL